MKLFGKKEFRCSNCGALIFEATFRKYNGLCGLCHSNPVMAKKRRILSQAAKSGQEPICDKCGRTETEIHRELEIAERAGVFIYMKDWPALLYCFKCKKYFCGSCQIDLGMKSGCPNCEEPLD